MLIKNCIRRTGEYQPDPNGKSIAYDNYIFQCEDHQDLKNLVFGDAKYKDVKVSVKDFNNVWKASPESLKGKDVIFAFDTNKHLIAILNNQK